MRMMEEREEWKEGRARVEERRRGGQSEKK